MRWTFFGKKVRDASVLFAGHFVEVRAFYAVEFDKIPCMSFIGEIESSKAFAWMEESFKQQVRKVYQHNYFDHENKIMRFNNTIFLLSDCRMIELGHNYCQVLHTPAQYEWANTLIADLAQFRPQ